MKQSKLKRLFSGLTAGAMIAGMMSVYQNAGMITVCADDLPENTEQISSGFIPEVVPLTTGQISSVVIPDVLPENTEPVSSAAVSDVLPENTEPVSSVAVSDVPPENTEPVSSVTIPDVLPETDELYTVKYTTTKFNLTGGMISDEKFTQKNGICTLKSEDDPSVIPQPSPPLNSNLVFSGWTDGENNAITAFEADTTYYANWKFRTGSETNRYSKLKYIIMNGKFIDIRGNNGNLRTTFGWGGYQLFYRVNGVAQSNISFSDYKSTSELSSGIYVTPVMSFCNAVGEVSEVDSDNVYLKVSYILQNRGDSEVSGIGIASAADVMIGGNDSAAIIGYSKDETKLTPENKELYQNASTVEMLDGSGNIYSIALPDDASCWWGRYYLRENNAFSDHRLSEYNTGYDSGIAYSWKDIVLGAGESVTKSVFFSAGDIHIFRTHDFDRDGMCNGSGHCGIPMDHTDQTPVIYQPAVLVDGVYKVSNAGQLMWIADKINSGEVAENVNIELTGNITFSANNPSDGSCVSTIPWKPINNFKGAFNGNGYTISGLYYDSEADLSDYENGGLFRTLTGATVENVGIINSCINGISKTTGTIAGTAFSDTIIRNVYSNASLSGSKSGGIVYLLSSSKIYDSYFAGSSSDNDYMVFSVIKSNYLVTCQNCYYLSDSPIQSQFNLSNANGLPCVVNKNIQQFKSGEVAYLLGDSWYQNLEDPGKNDYPVLIGDNHVYRYTVDHSCSEVDPQTEIIFTNDASLSQTAIKIQHEIVWGRMVKQATCTKNEYWTKKCKNCEYETTEIYQRDEEGHRATGHNHNSQGYCENVDPNTNKKCNHYDPAMTVPPVTTRPVTTRPVTTRPVTTTPVVSTTLPVTTVSKVPFSPVTEEISPEIEEVVERQKTGRLNISGDMHVTPMTKDEIINSGIDISGEDNYHCVNYSVEMKLEAEVVNLKKIEVEYDGVVHRVIQLVLPEKEPIRIEPTGTYVPEIGGSVIYYEEADQEMYMIIYGESKWLKEFYDVQLIVVNNDTEVLKNCETVLDVPDGLTLCNSAQTQTLGDLLPNKVFDIHWYLRGDKAGDYELQALFTGENAGEEFEYTFHSRNTLHVYAGNALNMTIELPEYSFYDQVYPVKIKLTNVSDKPVYNLVNKIKRVKQGYYTTYHIYQDGQHSELTEHTPLNDRANITSISVDTLDPGESAVVEVYINDMWKSILEQDIERSKLVADCIRLLSSTAGKKHPVAMISGVVASAVSKMLSEISVAHVLKSVVVTTLEGSTTEIPYNVVITDVPGRQTDKHGLYEISAMTKDNIKAELGDNTGSIDPSYYETQFIGCDYSPDADTDENTMNYINNRASQTASIIKNASGIGTVFKAVTVAEDLFLMNKTPSNDITARVYIENVIEDSPQSGMNIAPVSQLVRQPLSELPSLLSSDESINDDESFELSLDSGEGEYSNGQYSVTGNCILKINAKQAGKKAIIHIEYSDGYEIEYPVVSVEEHQCSGDYVFLSPPGDGKVGAAAQICSTCGKIIDVKQISSRYTCMLSNGALFENIRDAANAAAAYNKEGELAIFGNVHITEDIVIPSNISILIAPNAVVTIDDTCSLSTSGTITDFGSVDGKCMVNIILNYWQGRTELMQVPFGTEVTQLPQIGTDTCQLEGWYHDSEYTQPFESFVAGQTEVGLVYYANIHHQFSSKGICTQCGELYNGYDVFSKASITAGGDIKLNYIVRLSQRAASDNNAYMTFTFPDGSVKTQRVTSAKNNNNGTYTFTCKVDAAKMADNIIAQIHYSGNKTGSVLEYSMKKNIDTILRSAASFDPATVKALKALMNFGGYVQKFSQYNTEKLVNKDLNMPVDNQVVVIGDKYKAVKSGNSDKIKPVSASIDVSASVKIKIKFRVSENVNINNYRFTIDGKTVTPVRSEDMYIVSLNSISPEDYDEMYSFKAESLSDQNEWSCLDYSVFSYAKSIISNCANIDAVNAMKALYNYNVAIEELCANK